MAVRKDLVPVEQAMAPRGFTDPGGGTDMATIANWIVKSGYFGNTLDVPKVGVKLLVGQELGIGPMMAIRHVHIFDGGKGPRIVLGAEIMAALIKQSRDYDYTIVEHTDQICTVAVLRRDAEVGRASFSLADAQKAKLVGKDNWQGYPMDMLFWRAIARAFRRFTAHLAFGAGADVLTQEELDNEPMSHEQRKKLFAWANEQGMDEAGRHRWAGDVLGRFVTSWGWDCAEPITRSEATALINEAYPDGAEIPAEVPDLADADVAGEGALAPQAGDSPTATADDPDELAALRKKGVDEFRVLSSKLPAEWRPWFRNNVEEIKPGAWETWPKSFDVAELKEFFERLDRVRPWGDPDQQ